MHVCVRVCVYDIMSVRMFDVRVGTYVYARKRERKIGREGPKGMEKPIPSYQRKWLLADRKERHAFSAEDDNNKRLRSARSKLVRESLFIIGPYIPHDISISDALFPRPRIMDHLGSLSSLTNAGRYNLLRGR